MKKELQERFNYLVNSRKYRFDVYYLVHDTKTLASRVRRSFGNDIITRCNSIYSILNIEADSPLRKKVLDGRKHISSCQNWRLYKDA